ncbi:hypothetical protein F5H01DRAFT_343049 [Linnemannia elongata]|nr:hypothetical protein F5H01DRAFT_343049 [Linnemannia elongata]
MPRTWAPRVFRNTPTHAKESHRLHIWLLLFRSVLISFSPSPLIFVLRPSSRSGVILGEFFGVFSFLFFVF